MAEEKTLTPEEIKALQDQLAASEARNAELEAEKEELHNAMIEGKNIGVKINASFEASYRDGKGKPVKKKFGFKPGRKYLIIDGVHYLTEAVCQIAKGKVIEDEELLAKYPHLKDLTKERAVEHLTYMAKVNSQDLEVQ